VLQGIAAGLLLYLLLFFALDGVGLLGPDEPRYASIGREMALSGDWVTPRLWGERWFEKPALLYWLTGVGFRLGLGPETAPRLPVALLSAVYLLFHFWWLRRLFGRRLAWLSTAMLATSAGWFAYSQLCLTDLPLAAAFGASMLLCLRWMETGDFRLAAAAGTLLGVGVLAKGLVPLVLALPVFWFARGRRTGVAAIYGFALLAAAPWYVLCTLENGKAFLYEFFWRHHFARFLSPEFQHVQPFWYYAPVLAAGLAPWTPVLAAAVRPSLYRDRRLRFLLATAAFGFVFFSASTNKLPGYLLPLFPLLAVVLAAGLEQARRGAALLAASALLLSFIPVAGEVLPDAVSYGLSRAPFPSPPWWGIAAAVVLAVLVYGAERRERRELAVTLVAAGLVCGVVYLKTSAYPILDRQASARSLWRELGGFSHRVCIEYIHRSWRYGLNYYSLEPLPACADDNRPLHLTNNPTGGPPVLVHRD